MVGEYKTARAVMNNITHPYWRGQAGGEVARAQLDGGKLQQARRTLEVLIADDPSHADAYDVMGRVHVEQGALGEALETYRMATQLTPGSIERLQRQGMLAFYMGEHAEARRALERAASIGITSKMFDLQSMVLLAFARFHGRDVTLEVAKDALKDLLNAHNRQLTVEFIQKTVADYYKIKVADMHSKKRTRVIARPRQVAMFLAKDLTPMSLPAIGEAFGGRDHTTVLHAMRKIAEQRQHDPDLNHQIHVLEQTLRG